MDVTSDKLNQAMKRLRELAKEGDASAEVVLDSVQSLREEMLNIQTVIAGGITGGKIIMPVSDEVRALVEEVFLD